MLIREAVRNLTLEPPQGNIKLLQGYNDHRKRLRVGSWRIIYRNTKEDTIEVLLVLEIGNRGDIYK